jgi:hypothetical protein
VESHSWPAVFLLSIIFSLGGFAAGVYLTYRFVPPLRGTREGTIASWIVRVLTGAALSWAALELYFCIYAFAKFRPNEFRGPVVTGGRTEILTHALHSIFLLSGLLLAAAAIVYLLAPAGDEELPA